MIAYLCCKHQLLYGDTQPRDPEPRLPEVVIVERSKAVCIDIILYIRLYNGMDEQET